MRPAIKWTALLGSGLACLLLGASAWAAGKGGADVVGLQLGGTLGGKEELSSALRVFLVLTALSLLPAALICMTSFVRIVIVLSMLRHAIGLPETPPNMVVISLALFLTLFSMSPVIEQINTAAVVPYSAGKSDLGQAVSAAKAPLKAFMVRQTRESDLMLMVELAGAEQPKEIEDIGLAQLVPAFTISELRTAFQIGFVIFLPFLLIDIVVSSALMALGMMMVPPATIAIPVKILLFVLIDGWALVVKSLMGTFA